MFAFIFLVFKYSLVFLLQLNESGNFEDMFGTNNNDLFKYW